MSRAPARVGRNYTAARRHPWVLGRVGEWKLWFGPYTPNQLSVAFLGAFTLIKTVDYWAPLLGPIPVVLWAVAVWAVRGARIAGRDPLAALLGWASLLARPHAGRINGRTARDRAPRTFHGGFVIEAAPTPGGGPVVQVTPAASPVPRRPVTRQHPAPEQRPRRAAKPPRPAALRRRSGGRAPAPAPSLAGVPLSPLHQRLAASASPSRSSS